MKKWAAEKGITIETTAPYLPSQNGVAEHLVWTLLEMARAMIIAKGLPKFLWDEAVDEIALSLALEIANSHNSSQLRSYMNYHDH